MLIEVEEGQVKDTKKVVKGNRNGFEDSFVQENVRTKGQNKNKSRRIRIQVNSLKL